MYYSRKVRYTMEYYFSLFVYLKLLSTRDLPPLLLIALNIVMIMISAGWYIVKGVGT